MWAGALFALASGAAFGALAPLIAFFGGGLGPFAIAGLLGIGNALAARPSIAPDSRTQPIPRAALTRIAASGVCGPFLSVTIFAWATANFGANALAATGAITLAGLLWEIDNRISVSIGAADRNAVTVVKCTIGVVLAVVAAIVTREPLPGATAGFALIIAGAVCLGISRRWAGSARRGLVQAFPTRKPS